MAVTAVERYRRTSAKIILHENQNACGIPNVSEQNEYEKNIERVQGDDTTRKTRTIPGEMTKTRDTKKNKV